MSVSISFSFRGEEIFLCDQRGYLACQPALLHQRHEKGARRGENLRAGADIPDEALVVPEATVDSVPMTPTLPVFDPRDAA